MKYILFFTAILFLAVGCSTKDHKDASILEISLPGHKEGISYKKSSQWEGEDVLFWNTAKAGNSIYFKVSDKNIDAYKYLVCELYHNEAYSLRVGYNFYDDKSSGNIIEWQSGENTSNTDLQPRLAAKIGALPDLKTNIVFPLSHLDGQEIFLRRFPRQLKGTVIGHRIAKDEVYAFSISIDPFDSPQFAPEVQIKRIYFTDQPPAQLEQPASPIVDEFGQWASKEFKGKIQNEDELIGQLKDLENMANGASFPEKWSKYGGWKKKHFKATGFFYVINENGKWWMVDPKGYAFVSVGVDCIGLSASGWIEGQRDLFKWLPQEGDSLFSECYSDRKGESMFDFFISNMIRAYGTEWEDKWQNITVGLMKEYGINTIGNWSDMDFIQNADMPYVYPMSKFPSTNTLLYRDFPDVFSKEYQDNAAAFATQLEPLKDDPYMIGYFLRNEPHWAFGKNNIAFEMFANATPSDSKNEFVKWVAEQYEDIREFNRDWQLELGSFEDLTDKVLLEMPSEKAKDDLWAFSKILVRKYVDVVCDEVEKIDDNHLNLGMRYGWISSVLLYEAGERFDVFSINGYRIPLPPETADIFEKSERPVMIGEFHFGSIDRGLPSTGLTGVANQEERGKVYRNYVEHGLSRDELIGVHYFQWLDQPVFGRSDGENYNIGVLSITYTPYKELVEAMKQTNLNIYEIITGEIPIYSDSVEIIPAISF